MSHLDHEDIQPVGVDELFADTEGIKAQICQTPDEASVAVKRSVEGKTSMEILPGQAAGWVLRGESAVVPDIGSETLFILSGGPESVGFTVIRIPAGQETLSYEDLSVVRSPIRGKATLTMFSGLGEDGDAVVTRQLGALAGQLVRANVNVGLYRVYQNPHPGTPFSATVSAELGDRVRTNLFFPTAV